MTHSRRLSTDGGRHEFELQLSHRKVVKRCEIRGCVGSGGKGVGSGGKGERSGSSPVEANSD